MKCVECGGIYQLRTDRYIFPDPYVGPIRIEGKPYYKCDKCHEILLTNEISIAIDEARRKRQTELINKYPVGDFITSSEALQILGITRQALNKNHRIKSGFIYQTKIGNVNLYLKQSVLIFKDTGDGRFPLCNNNEITRSYEIEAVSQEIDESYYLVGNSKKVGVIRETWPSSRSAAKKIKSKKSKR